MRAGTLGELLDSMTAPAELVETVDAEKGTVRCLACGHRCLIRKGRRGICQVRFNRDGELRVPFGYVAGLQVDPTEKKPFYHVLPGSKALSFGMMGCNMHCDYCQNWVSSQALRDPIAGVNPTRISPDEMIEIAKRYNAECIASTYNEPLITTEWAVAIFKLARPLGIRTLYVSNGYASPEVVEYLKPYLDGFKIDLKTMQDKQYRRLGAVLQKVLDTVEAAYGAGMWVEVVTLVVPGFNDSTDELWDLARFIVSVSPDIPWHVSAFHPDYKMTDSPPTSVRTLVRAAEIGLEAGLRYVYAGNLPGVVGEWENTRCPNCGETLIRRRGFYVLSNRLRGTGGKCPNCGFQIAGIWE